MEMTMEPGAIIRQVSEAGVKLIRFLYCGSDGVIRGKCIHADYLEERLKAGIGLTVAMQSFTLVDQLV
ncbi:MAG: glutamine synthetase, partial [Nitrospinota bacterium]